MTQLAPFALRTHPHATKGRRRLRYLACAGAVLLAAGCSLGGQTGGEVKDDPGGGITNEGPGSNCDETRTVMSMHEERPLGFAAVHILAFAEGEHESEMAWTAGMDDENGNWANLEVTPTAGETTIRLQLSYEDGEVRHIDSEPKTSTNEGPLIEIDEPGGACPDRMEIDMVARLIAGNGAFDETFDVTVVARTERMASIYWRFEPSELNGSFAVNVVEPENAEIVQTALSAAITPDGISGRIDGLVQQEHGDAVSAGGVTFGRFPDVDCGSSTALPFDVEGDGLAARAFAAAVPDGPLSLAWENGDTTELVLEVTPQGEYVCYSEAYGDSEISLPTMAHVTTADGRVDGQWPLTIYAEPNADGEIVAARMALEFQTVAPGEFESQYGVSGFDLSAYDYAQLSFGLQTEFAGDSTSRSGTLTVIGAEDVMCPVESEDPNSTPGCPGDTFVEVETAVISEP